MYNDVIDWVLDYSNKERKMRKLKRLLAVLVCFLMITSLLNVGTISINAQSNTENINDNNSEDDSGQQRKNGALDAGVTFKRRKASNANGKESLAQATSLPTNYDSRDPNGDGNTSDSVVTAVRNQLYGDCWANSAIAVAETSAIKQKRTINAATPTVANLKLSVRQLEYFMYNSVADPLGNTNGDKDCKIGDNCDSQVAVNEQNLVNIYNMGGNSILAIILFSQYYGLDSDVNIPYTSDSDTAGNDLIVDDNKAYNALTHLRNGYYLDYGYYNDSSAKYVYATTEQINEIKSELQVLVTTPLTILITKRLHTIIRQFIPNT